MRMIEMAGARPAVAQYSDGVLQVSLQFRGPREPYRVKFLIVDRADILCAALSMIQ